MLECCAGFQVKKKQFFRNFVTIMLFGAVGTLISFIVISLGAIELFRKLDIGALDVGDFLTIGAIFSATNSVCTLQVLNQDETPLLYSLVFGEGIVNDATSIVLFNALESLDLGRLDAMVLLKFVGNFLYLFSTSTLLGVSAGLLSAYIIKTLYFGRHSTDREVSLMILMAYLSYMLAELLDLSGILTVFFCGIVMSHYTWHNVTKNSRVTTKHTFATLSFIADVFLFLYVGMDALDIERWKFASNSPGKSIFLSSILLGLVLIGKAAFVFPISFLSNLSVRNPEDKITFNQQFSRSDLTQLPSHAIMITSTITVVLFSTVVFGMMTKPLMMLLLPTRHLSTSSEPSSSFFESLLGNSQGSEIGAVQSVPNPSGFHMLFSAPSRAVHRYWRKFDDAFMRPVFGGRGFVPFVPGSPTERSLHIGGEPQDTES
ncbi:sodium/hydrogen exchanger 1-like [Typha latifolia]|uniref:sodium/hydrogen exchanger 1-like n=1 Tax=Typha latifolia TaxID=4733 RepID=UPI003C2E3ED1